ncbi:hypothetical protein FRB90_005201 [Tulasnella sp. 427]|nr:hypothetical protein FRB90_005201 [Tulasnella sp. 427]
MTRKEYLEAVLAEVEKYPVDRAALIVSVDRRMSVEDALECVNLAIELKSEGRRVVGVDLCGDPRAGDMKDFLPVFELVHQAGLGLTLHIAEVSYSELPPDTDVLLSARPTRLGHATFLNDPEKDYVRANKIPIEICLTSNLLCKTVTDLESHHINAYLQQNHPISICTDDILPFRTSLTAEYALLLAKPPLGLGLTEEQVEKIAKFAHLLGNTPSSPSLIAYLERISSTTNPPAVEIKSYSDAVYYNYHALGLSLLFVPTNGYKPRTGSTRTELKEKDLVLDSVDIYNAQPKGTKDSRSGFSIFPSLPSLLRKPGETTSTSTLEVGHDTTGKDFVAFLGEPARKGGGGGPAGGSIGIWCEWKAGGEGVMVEFGGDDARSWDRGKDAVWSVLTLFRG